MRKLILQPAETLRNTHGPAFAPVAGTSLLWVSNADDDPFREATGAFYYFVTAYWLSKKQSALPRTDFITASQNPDYGAFGRGAVVYGP